MAKLAGMAPPYHPCPGRVGDRGKKAGVRCILHIPFTIPELRRLLVRLVWSAIPAADRVCAWSLRNLTAAVA